MRKTVLVTLALLLLGTFAAAQKPQKAADILKTAQTKAAEQNKNILLIFGASWCEACHQLDTFLALPDIATIMDQHFVVAHVTFGEGGSGHPEWDNPGSDVLITRYGGVSRSGNVGLPFIAVLDSKARLIANSEISTKNDQDSTGFPVEPAEIKAFLAMLQKGTPTLTAEDIHKIETGLHQAAAD